MSGERRGAVPARMVDPPRSLGTRIAHAVRPTAEMVGAGVVAMGATFVLAPGTYLAAKAALAGWGIPPAAGGLMAPVAAGAAIWGLRWCVRRFRSVDDTDQPAR